MRKKIENRKKKLPNKIFNPTFIVFFYISNLMSTPRFFHKVLLHILPLDKIFMVKEVI